MVIAEQVEIPASTQRIIWDLDGTLLDSFGIYESCMNKMLHSFCDAPAAPTELLRQHYSGSLEESIENVLVELGELSSRPFFRMFVDGFYELDNAAYGNDINQHLFPDAVDLANIAHLHNKQQTVVTNRLHGVDRQNGSPRNIIAGSCLKNMVDAVICGDDTTTRKPHPYILHPTFGDKLGQLGETVIIGDQAVDGEFAQNLGCTAILVARNGEIPHFDKLGDAQGITVVASLDHVTVAA